MEAGERGPVARAAATVRMERSLAHFSREAVKHVPFGPDELEWNWHIDLFCEVLERVYRGEIRNLLILAPPRHTKSLIASAFWPAWVWVRDPGFEWITGSHKQGLSRRDVDRHRKVVASDWYQARWGHLSEPDRETWSRTEIANLAGGRRLATSVGSGTTGRGGDAIIIDDPIDIDDARSEEVRNSTWSWFTDTISSRLNHPKRGRKVVIGQRTHPRDLAGRLLEGESQNRYEVVQLPGLYEEAHSRVTPEGLEDPREEGEPLHPARAEEEDLRGLVPGSEAVFQTVIQQNARSRGGTLFDRGDIQLAEGDLWGADLRVVYIDKASTAEEDAGPSTSYTAMVQLAMDIDRRVRIEDVERGRWSSGPRENRIEQFCERVARRLENRPGIGDPRRAFKIFIEQEPGGSGKDVAEATVARLQRSGFRAETDRAGRDKFGRMDPFAGAVERGEVEVKKGEEWVEPFLAELDDCAPGVPIVDQADAASGGYNRGVEVLAERDKSKKKSATVFGV